MNTTETSSSTRLKVGLFTLTGLIFIGILTVYVNDKPYWYRPCQLVRINVEDATGLRAKSPVRSLGLEIGYLKTVELTESHVTLGICITAPVEVLPTTRAYLRGEGFLGDKFVELKPVKYIGGAIKAVQLQNLKNGALTVAQWTIDRLIPSAHAQTAQAPGKEGREIPVGSQTQDVQQLVNRVDELVEEMTDLTTNLKSSINPIQLKETMRQLNQTLENASKTLSPQGGLTQTAQRTLGKLEDSIEQLRALMTRVNQGEGSVGMLLNDPSYADEIRDTLRNLNQLVGGARKVRFFVDIGGEQFTNFEDGRAWFQLSIWPKPERYYLLGVSVDPRGRRKEIVTTTTVDGLPPQSVKTVEFERTGLLVTAMVGEVWWKRVDLSIGALFGDGALSMQLNLGPKDNETRIQVRNDIYSGESKLNSRLTAIVRPFKALYVKGGIESFRTIEGEMSYFVGAGVRFEDEDIKLLFALR